MRDYIFSRVSPSWLKYINYNEFSNFTIVFDLPGRYSVIINWLYYNCAIFFVWYISFSRIKGIISFVFVQLPYQIILWCCSSQTSSKCSCRSPCPSCCSCAWSCSWSGSWWESTGKRRSPVAWKDMWWWWSRTWSCSASSWDLWC